MTDADKLTMLKTFLGDDAPPDATLNTYLDFTKREIIYWRYQYSSNPEIAKATDSEDNIVTVKINMFIGALSPTTGTSYVFTYSEDNESWQYESADVELEDYGLSLSDLVTPVDAETITVDYNETALVQYDMIQVDACMAGYSQSGAENETAHSENGVSRTFEYASMVKYIHDPDHVQAYVGVV